MNISLVIDKKTVSSFNEIKVNLNRLSEYSAIIFEGLEITFVEERFSPDSNSSFLVFRLDKVKTEDQLKFILGGHPFTKDDAIVFVKACFNNVRMSPRYVGFPIGGAITNAIFLTNVEIVKKFPEYFI